MKILGPRQIDSEVVRERLMRMCKMRVGGVGGKMVAHHCNECKVYSVLFAHLIIFPMLFFFN